jgi:hypothetical protein
MSYSLNSSLAISSETGALDRQGNIDPYRFDSELLGRSIVAPTQSVEYQFCSFVSSERAGELLRSHS